MKTKTISGMLLTLVIASMLFSVIPVMAAPVVAEDMNPNLSTFYSEISGICG